MNAVILYTLGNDHAPSKEAEKILRSAGATFKIQPHLFTDTDQPVVRMPNGELLVGPADISSFFPQSQHQLPN